MINVIFWWQTSTLEEGISMPTPAAPDIAFEFKT
jgi:hypothetical protein